MSISNLFFLTQEYSRICVKAMFGLWSLPYAYSKHIAIPIMLDIVVFQTMSVGQTLSLCVDALEKPNLTAIVDSLLEHDTLQTLSVSAGCANDCPIEDVDAAFLRSFCRRDAKHRRGRCCILPKDYQNNDPRCFVQRCAIAACGVA